METRETFRVSDWEGLNTRDSDLEIPIGASPYISNIEFFREGWKTRQGITKLHAAAIAAKPVSGIFDGWNHILAYCGAGIHKWNSGTSEWDAISGALTDSAIPMWTSYNALDIFVNGSANSNPQKWDGATLAALGGSPPKADCVALWHNRIWLSGLASPNQGEVRYSDLELPETWNGDFIRPSKQAKGVSVVAALPCPVPDAVDGERLVCFCDQSIWHFDGFSKSTWDVKPVNNKIGLVAPRSVVVAEGITYWMGHNGFYASYDGGRTVNLISWNIQPTFDDLSDSRLQYAVGVHHRYKRQIWWSVSNTTSSTHNRVLVYNYGLSTPMHPAHLPDSRHVWSIYDLNLQSAAEVLVTGAYQLWGGDSGATGFVHRLDQGSSDNGTAISWGFRTKRFLLKGTWTAYQILRRLMIVHDAMANATMRVKLYTDTSRTAQEDIPALDLSGSAAAFGVARFGIDVFGGTSTRVDATQWFNRWVRAVQFEFSGNDLAKLVRVYEIAFETLPKRGMR